MKTASNKKKMFLFLGLISAIGIFVLTAPAQAGFEWAAELLGGIIGWIISALGIILVLIIKALVFVAQYNNFINSQAVENGWRIVRDVANMFFVVVLLIISFATILNQEKYSYKTWLPKVILMAVLINFSKTICGILIDVAQVAMLTFVNAFKGMAAGNLVSNLGILEIVTIANDSGDIGFWAIIGSYFLGLLYMIVAIVTIVTMLAMLVMRMVMIWIYVVLSPAAYLFAAFPGGQKYSSMWWTEFSKNLIVGPVLAFFIWLSFVSMQSYDIAKDFGNTPGVVTTEGAGKELAMDPSSAYGNRGGTQANELDVFLKFIISIGMLIGGLKIANEIGGAAGKIAGSGMAKLQKGTSFVAGAAGGFALARAKSVGRKAGHLAGAAVGGVDRTLGAGLDYGLKKVGKKVFKKDISTNFAGRGLVNTVATGAKNLPGNLYNKTISKINKNKELDDKRRDYLEQEKTVGRDKAVLSYNGKSYKRDEQDDRFYEVDEKGVEKLADDGNRSYLKVGDPGKEKDIKAMNGVSAAWRDSWRSSGTYSRTISNKEEEKKISEEQQRMSDSGATSDELRRGLMSKSSSATQKKAYAMLLASQGKFQTKEEIEEAKKYVGSNDLLSNKFEDLVDSKQAHLNYDLSLDVNGKYKNENDVSRFKSRIDGGKINPTKLSADAFKKDDGGLLKALKEFHGVEYKGVIESNAKQSKDHNSSIEDDLLRNRKFDESGKIAVDKEGKLDSNAVLAARTTGNVDKAFALRDGGIDEDALAKYIKEAKIGDINKIDASKLKDDNDDPNKNILAEQLKKAISEGMNFSKLKGMLKQGDNPALVSRLANYMAKSQHVDYKLMKADREIMSVLGDEAKRNKVLGEEKRKDESENSKRGSSSSSQKNNRPSRRVNTRRGEEGDDSGGNRSNNENNRGGVVDVLSDQQDINVPENGNDDSAEKNSEETSSTDWAQ